MLAPHCHNGSCRYVRAICISSSLLTLKKDFVSLCLTLFFSSYLNADGYRRFCWTASRQGWLKSSFFWGYILLQIHGGSLAEKLGTRKVLGTALFITAILTLLTPLVAVWNVNLLFALRILMGVAEAVTFPSLPPLIQRLEKVSLQNYR